MCNYGFVYLWFDKKHKKFYLGSHWGDENDGYICSSNNMRENHRNRSHDFKRRIIKRIYTNRTDLLNEEQRWLDMIKSNEFGFRYYNINNKAFCNSWWVNEYTRKHISEKLKGNKNGCVPCSPEKAKKISEAKKKKFQERRNAGLPNYEEQAAENLKIAGQKRRGRIQSEQEIENRRQANLNWWKSNQSKKWKNQLTTQMIGNKYAAKH